MFTFFVVGLALIVLAMLGALVVLTWGCLSGGVGWCADRVRGMRAARVQPEADAA